MKSKEKILSLVSCGALLAMLLMPVKTHAAVQANGSGATPKTINDWLSSVREMEAQGGTLGLTGSADLTGNDSTPNNLDIHMQKNTEYGAMAILSASSYGKSTPVHETSDGSLSTTTGNKSGVYMTLNTEWVAAGCDTLGTSVNNFKNASIKYKNVYNLTYVAKAGDAITETNNWHTTSNSNAWFGDRSNGGVSGLIRAIPNSIFSYYGTGAYSYNGVEAAAHYSKTYQSRAVIVLGNGF